MNSVVTEVTESARLYGRTHVLWLTLPDELRHATPGQFVMAYAGEHDDPLLGRPFSFHRLREGRHGPEFALLFDIVGRVTDWLSWRRPSGPTTRTESPGRRHRLRTAGLAGGPPDRGRTRGHARAGRTHGGAGLPAETARATGRGRRGDGGWLAG